MRQALSLLLIATAGIAVARVARVEASHASPDVNATPFAPSPEAAPFLSLGYREVAADLFYVRLIGYFAVQPDPDPAASIAEAIVALDPNFAPAYELGAIALTDARYPGDQMRELHAIDLLERGMKQFPTYWRLPDLAGKIYISDLTTTDPVQRRAWDDKGALLLESASRKPGGPTDTALLATALQTKSGQKQRAIESLRELLLLTEDPTSRAQIFAQLAKVSNENSDELAAEIEDNRRRFETAWKRDRSDVPASMYVLIGAALARSFDLGDLATGGRDLVGAQSFERLEPVTDP